MPYVLELLAPLGSDGWKVKIFDKEGPEEPHVTIIRKTEKWRVSLRTLQFLDREPPPSAVPGAVMSAIEAGLEELAREWDRRFPFNPVSSEQ